MTFIIKLLLIAPFYLIDDRFLLLKPVLALVHIPLIYRSACFFLERVILKRLYGGKLSAIIRFAYKLLIDIIVAVVFLHFLTCLLVGMYKSNRSSEPIETSYLRYFYLAVDLVYNNASEQIIDDSTNGYLLMIVIVVVATGIFVVTISILYGLITSLNQM